MEPDGRRCENGPVHSRGRLDFIIVRVVALDGVSALLLELLVFLLLLLAIVAVSASVRERDRAGFQHPATTVPP